MQATAERTEEGTVPGLRSLPHPSPPNALRTNVGRARVLVAEDDAPLRGLIAGALQDEGYEVVEAKDGIELLANIEAALVRERHPCFVVVADVHMPGLTGLDVLAILRCSFVPAPVIIITAFGDEETRAEAWELGASAVFDKPFELEELRAAVLEAAAG